MMSLNTCPYCGLEYMPEYYDMPVEEWQEEECPKCGKTMRIKMHGEIWFESERGDE